MMGEHQKPLPSTLQHVCDVLPVAETKLSQIQCNHNGLPKDSDSFYILISVLIKFKLIRHTDPASLEGLYLHNGL